MNPEGHSIPPEVAVQEAAIAQTPPEVVVEVAVETTPVSAELPESIVSEAPALAPEPEATPPDPELEAKQQRLNALIDHGIALDGSNPVIMTLAGLGLRSNVSPDVSSPPPTTTIVETIKEIKDLLPQIITEAQKGEMAIALQQIDTAYPELATPPASEPASAPEAPPATPEPPPELEAIAEAALPEAAPETLEATPETTPEAIPEVAPSAPSVAIPEVPAEPPPSPEPEPASEPAPAPEAPPATLEPAPPAPESIPEILAVEPAPEVTPEPELPPITFDIEDLNFTPESPEPEELATAPAEAAEVDLPSLEPDIDPATIMAELKLSRQELNMDDIKERSLELIKTNQQEAQTISTLPDIYANPTVRENIINNPAETTSLAGQIAA
ncbi:hypothetical protein FWH30_02560 [Microgenomates group bacterium]|nr:hypothetical protein [Microgenomates group bacterium]